MVRINIYRVGDEPAIRFAAGELRRCLKLAIGGDVRVAKRKARTDERGLWLSVGDQPRDDDVIDIDVTGDKGDIVGANPRAVLLAVYRYLTELGFRWVRPGRDGEVIPQLRKLPARRIRVRETPSYKHRGICIEGASSWEHVRDMIDWAPKLGFNTYFVQFRWAYYFFERWYNHFANPRLAPEGFDQRKAEKLTRGLWEECQRRGLSIQQVGHGWTCDPFGVPGRGWFQHKGKIPASIRPYLAQVNGKREFWGGVALNTNLCYGNPKVQRTMTRSVADYAVSNSQVDVIHVWLADGYNNHCECPRCRSTQPADFYVQILNEIDAELTRRGLETKIVFLLYVDLLWPPKKKTLNNPDRFILMFAPISRTYTKSYTGATGRMRPFKFNRITLPPDVGENLAYLRAWQKKLPGVRDSFIFDYHLMWDHHKDQGQEALAKVMHEDVRELKNINLDGFVSCQIHRLGMPTMLIQTVLGRTLWNRSTSFNAIADDYYQAAFGRDGKKVRAYLKELSKVFDPPLLRGERNTAPAKRASLRKIKQIPAVIDEFSRVIERNTGGAEGADRSRAQSWTYLKHHATLCLAMTPVLEAIAREESADVAMTHLIHVARRLEKRTHRVLDTFNFMRTIGDLVGWDEQRVRKCK